MVNDDEPLPYANVVILAPDSALVKGTLTDEEGNFKVSIAETATAWLRADRVVLRSTRPGCRYIRG